MNEYWDTSTDAELIAGRLETIADLLEKLIKVGKNWLTNQVVLVVNSPQLYAVTSSRATPQRINLRSNRTSQN